MFSCLQILEAFLWFVLITLLNVTLIILTLSVSRLLNLIMSQVTEQSVRFQTALASIKLIQASAVLDLTEDDFDFLTSNKVWIATDRSRARRCVEACVYGTLDFVGYPR